MTNTKYKIFCNFVKTEAMKWFNNKDKTKTVEDTGLRGTFEGRLYVDKAVFYKRADVQNVIKKLKESVVIKEQIETAKS